MQHTVAEDGVLLKHLHGDGSARVGIDGELDLGEAALPDGPAHLVPPHPLLPPAGIRHSPLLGQPPPPDAAPSGARGPSPPAPAPAIDAAGSRRTAGSQAEPREGATGLREARAAGRVDVYKNDERRRRRRC
jgi:hypothetical protein